MTKRETAYTMNIHLASGTVFKLHLRDGWEQEWEPSHQGAPIDIGPHLGQFLSIDHPGRNTLLAIDWGHVDAITYRRPAEGSAGRPASVTGDDIIAALRAGQVRSGRALAQLMDCHYAALRAPLSGLVEEGRVEAFPSSRGGTGYRLVEASD